MRNDLPTWLISSPLPNHLSGTGIWLSLLILSCILLFSQVSIAQQAYNNPASYHIQAALDTSAGIVRGHIEIDYRNTSSEPLDEIHVHLYPNAYNSRESALTKQHLLLGKTGLFFADESERGYIDSLEFHINDESIEWSISGPHVDIAILALPNTLGAGERLKLTTPFRVILPDAEFSRLGFDNQTYYLTNWYPEIAVFDGKQWHSMPYLEQGEFYSEFADFKVELTVPEGFIVASTGRCVSGNCSVPKKASHRTKKVVLERDSVHGFVVFTGNNFNQKSQIISIPGHKDVKCSLFFLENNSSYYDSAFVYIERILPVLADVFGEYPYDEFTIVDGGISGGVNMEYPCITLFQSPTTHLQMEQLIVHEMSHMWNYAAVRFNERSHAWFDEGLSVFSELLYFDRTYPGVSGEELNKYMTGIGFIDKHCGPADLSITESVALQQLSASRLGTELPPSMSAEFHSNTSYYNSVYAKAGLSWYLLYNSAGHDSFTSCMQRFFSETKFHRSDPDELRSSMESCLGTDLGWFFSSLLSDKNPIDLTIKNDSTDTIRIHSSNSNQIPVKVERLKGDDSEFHSEIWSNPSDWKMDLKAEIERATYTASNQPFADHRPSDNQIRSDGKRPLNYSFKFLSDHGLHSEREIYWLPLVAYNEYNGLMPGIMLHNYSIAPRSLEFHIAPFFDLQNSYVSGVAGISKTWRFKDTDLRMIKAGLGYRKFLYDSESVSGIESLENKDPLGYEKFSISADLGFGPTDAISTVTNRISFIHHSVLREIITYTPSGENFIPDRENKHFGFQSLSWMIQDNRTLDPYSTSVRMENGDEYLKIQLEFKYRFTFSNPSKGLDVRVHFGKFIFNDQQEYNYNFRMDGWTGADDYLFNDYYFGRTETSGLWSRQFLLKDGAFKVPTAVGQSNNWNAALNIQVDNPTPLPVRFFIDIGTYAGIQDVFEDLNNVIMYDAGVCISLGKGAFEVYLPLFISKDIEQELEINERNSLSDKIRFVFDIKKLSPLRLRNKIHGVQPEY